MAKIQKIIAREILDSRGNPTIEVDLFLDGGAWGRASVPSGASTGSYEAVELRDGEKRYAGKGVLKAVANVNDKIRRTLEGGDYDQESLDEAMISLDGTENKENLGANAILGVSLAFSHAMAAKLRVPLYKYFAEISKTGRPMSLPVPMVLVLEGGKHADQSSDLQEFMVFPHKAKSFAEAIEIGEEIYHEIGKILKKGGFNINVGFEGAYGPSLKSNEKVFQIITRGIEQAGYKAGEEVSIAVDGAGSELYKDGKYHLEVESRVLERSEMIDFYESLCRKYPIISLEDPMAEDDWDGWAEITNRLGDKIQIIGDDLTVTNIQRISQAIDKRAINSVLIKPNQIGTVTETIRAVKMATDNGMTAVVSHRSGETEDTTIADLVVGLGTAQSKFGAPARSERLAKYNQLLRIEQELGESALFLGKKALKGS